MPDSRRSWAGVLGASGRGGILPSGNALYPADALEVGVREWPALACQAAELAQAWGD